MYNFYFKLIQTFLPKNETIFTRKCFNTLRPKYLPRSKMFQYPHVEYYYEWYRVLTIFKIIKVFSEKKTLQTPKKKN